MKPEEYKELFETHNVKPVRGYYLCMTPSPSNSSQCMACAVGIRLVHAMKSVDSALARNESTDEKTRAILCEEAGMSADFARGLDFGWESGCETPYLAKVEGVDDFKDGYNEGFFAAQMCIGPKY